MDDIRIALALVMFGVVVLFGTVMDTRSKICELLDLAQAEEDEETDEDGKDPE